jgi:hypothetical protein
MMNANPDPWLGPPGRYAALAGWAKLSSLDEAERLVARVRDQAVDPTERLAAFDLLADLHPTLWQDTASRLVSDSADTVRTAAQSALAMGGDLGDGAAPA